MTVKALPLFPTAQHKPRAAFSIAPPPPAQVSEQEAKLARERAEVQALRMQYEKSIRQLAVARENVVNETMTELRELVFAVGRELALKELSATPDAVQTLLTDLIAGLGSQRSIEVRVAEEDAARVQAPEGSDLRIKPDATLRPGSCMINAVDVSIDASFEGREERVRAVLGLESELQ